MAAEPRTPAERQSAESTTGEPATDAFVSELFDPTQWKTVDAFAFTDITYHRCVSSGPEGGTVRIAFNRPEVRNAFRPHTVDELAQALEHARTSPDDWSIVDPCDKLAELLTGLTQHDVPVLLCGDLNARTNTERADDSDPMRSSRDDAECNTRGRWLLQTARDADPAEARTTDHRQ